MRQVWQFCTLQTILHVLPSVDSSNPALHALQTVLDEQLLQFVITDRQFWTHDF